MKNDWSATLGVAIGIGVASLIGLFVLGLGLRNVYRGLASAGWPTTNGVVVESVSSTSISRGASDNSHRTSAMYSPTTIVRFRVGDRDYETGTRQFGQFEGSGDESFAAIETRRFPVGKNVRVSYNPAHPGVATVKAGLTASVLALPLAGMAFLAVTLLAFVASRDGNPIKTVMTIFSLIFCAIGVGFLIPGMVALWRGYESKSWPTTTALIVYGTPNSDDEKKYQRPSDDSLPADSTFEVSNASHRLVYRYDIGGEHHYGNERQFGQLSYSSTSGWSDAIAARYALGHETRVSYSPTDADLSVLDPGFTKEALYLPGAGAAFLLFGLAVLTFGMKALE